ncbi:hypothetical protein [Acinetobacter nectaris]|uniref:hypothetical protein n=1 Tax=Acinetobacter nectaris TaxID=1219382 RepID=UPI001F19F7DA|nr:hypothetical protein [Acinetobacter nectaris]MCF9047514.1 hypothetical protein [Acinetobacter nectaris]
MTPVLYKKPSKFSVTKDLIARNYAKLGAVATVAVLSNGAHADGLLDASPITNAVGEASSNGKIVFAAALTFIGLLIAYKKLKRAANSA